ncbi:hypothetical protein ACLIMP_08300 [Novosphingobium aerophilum]|uniref:hypothetical protein n=1 Tax=Novosphingobium TaxID=165696 RepID=UPI002D764FC1|nr:hypothetical protein [Novosphingobium sp. RL4]WRT94221.1 hypothetical protein U9J33_06880 [Novosphingobium sp. RL4]
MSLLPPILFAIGACVAIRAIWGTYRSTLPAIRALHRASHIAAASGDIEWSTFERRSTTHDSTARAVRRNRRPIRSKPAPHHPQRPVRERTAA